MGGYRHTFPGTVFSVLLVLWLCPSTLTRGLMVVRLSMRFLVLMVLVLVGLPGLLGVLGVVGCGVTWILLLLREGGDVDI